MAVKMERDGSIGIAICGDHEKFRVLGPSPWGLGCGWPHTFCLPSLVTVPNLVAIGHTEGCQSLDHLPLRLGIHRGAQRVPKSGIIRASPSSIGNMVHPCWRRSIVVRTLVSAGELSLSCTRLLAGWVITLRLSHLLLVSQHGQLSHPSLRGR